MTAKAWASWLDRLESARSQEQALSNKIRTGNTSAIGTSVFALQQSVSRLKRDFDQLKRSSGSVTLQEIQRRERLLNELARDQQQDLEMYNNRTTSRAALTFEMGCSPGATDASVRLLGMQNQIMKDQDQQLDLIGEGVANLRNYSLTVKDETELHVRLLNEIDDDVSRVTDGLESEGLRAARVAKQGNNTKLYVIILVLVVILIFLLLDVELTEENSNLEENSIQINSKQQQKLRQAYQSPMRPTQYTHGTEDNVNNEQTSLDCERLSMEQVLLGHRWLFHCTSPLFHFEFENLSEYAHDLVKNLRAAALRACGKQFGYSVSIRNTDTFVAFQIQEVRERCHDTAMKTGTAQSENMGIEHSGGVVLDFSTEDQRTTRKGREKQQVLLLRGNEELLCWVCSWLQRRFQCVVSTHVVRIQQLNLKRLARNWTVASLIAERVRLSRGNEDQDAGDGRSIPVQESLRAPVKLKYRAAKEEDVVRTYTLTLPWAMLRRLFQQTVVDPSTSVPDLIVMAERMYVDSFSFDISTYELERIEMQEVAVDLDGGVELHSMDIVQAVLSGLLELLAIQDVVTTSRSEMTL
ncbi:hypothetical protein PsorP6_003649 [Peronosclerospora sorghi]|uniref:Uncharacterized protein n=1 Tax=Peronosclerospora sorghi TaxID=230839 RepID=A0ACC0VLF1_9STRA|nr:hypothetical protein PsorP6_003649 [Peronosclerospora sorghi]